MALHIFTSCLLKGGDLPLFAITDRPDLFSNYRENKFDLSGDVPLPDAAETVHTVGELVADLDGQDVGGKEQATGLGSSSP